VALAAGCGTSRQTARAPAAPQALTLAALIKGADTSDVELAYLSHDIEKPYSVSPDTLDHIYSDKFRIDGKKDKDLTGMLQFALANTVVVPGAESDDYRYRITTRTSTGRQPETLYVGAFGKTVYLRGEVYETVDPEPDIFLWLMAATSPQVHYAVDTQALAKYPQEYKRYLQAQKSAQKPVRGETAVK
jgi:hypothetical protein